MATQTTIQNLTIHPVCEIAPEMDEAQFKAFVEDIRNQGQLVPIVTHRGQIIDGRHRWRACQELGIVCRTEEWEPGDGQTLGAIVRSLNAERRHLTAGQRATLAVDLEPFYKEEAAARMKKGTLASREARVGKSLEHAAKAAGASRASAERAKKLKADDPAEFDKVKKGKKSLGAASKAAKAKKSAPPPKKQKEGPLLDKAGREYPDPDVARALGQTGEFDLLVNEVNSLRRKIERYAERPVFKELRIQQIQTDLKNVSAIIRFAIPYTTCPYAPNCKRGCKLCDGAKWITKAQWERVPDEDKL